MKLPERIPFFPETQPALSQQLARLWRTLIDYIQSRDTMAIAVHSSAITADALVKTGPCIYRGFTVTVATATAAIDIRDGTSAGAGTVIDTINATTAAATRVEKIVGIYCDNGIFVDYAASATGTLVVHYEVV